MKNPGQGPGSCALCCPPSHPLDSCRSLGGDPLPVAFVGRGVCDFLSEHPAPKLRQQDKLASLSLSLLICRVGTLMKATTERCSARFSQTNLFRSHDVPKMWGSCCPHFTWLFTAPVKMH